MEKLNYTYEETVEDGKKVTNVYFDEDLTKFKWVRFHLKGVFPKRKKKKNPAIIYGIK